MDISTGVAIASFAMDAIYYTLLVQPLHVFRHLKKTQSAHELLWLEKSSGLANYVVRLEASVGIFE
jgi:hypothetical protein